MIKLRIGVMLLMEDGYIRGEDVKDMANNIYPMYVRSVIIVFKRNFKRINVMDDLVNLMIFETLFIWQIHEFQILHHSQL